MRSAALPRRSGRLRIGTLAAIDLFLVLGLLGVYLKHALLNRQWDAVARFLGKVDAAELGALERLGFFFDDFALNLLVIPLVGTVAIAVLFRTYRVAAALVLTCALALAYFVELRAQQEVGQYVSRDGLRDLVGWAAMHPGMGVDYVTGPSLVKLVAMLAVLVGIALIARRGARAEARGDDQDARRARLVLVVPAIVLLVCGIVLTGVAYAARTPDLVLTTSAVGRALSALAADRADAGPHSARTFAQVLAASRRQTATPPLDPGHPFAGRAEGADLLVFVMETGPALALDLAEAGRDLPGTGALYDHALLATEHYTTHPYSSDAMYSMLSGLYPQGRQRLVRGSAGARINGLLTALADVPIRRVYLPSLFNLLLDEQMYTMFGAERVYTTDRHRSDPLQTVAEQRADGVLQHQAGPDRDDDRARAHLRTRLIADFHIMERVKADITAAVHGGSRYAIVFFPGVGHAPWLALDEERAVMERGRALMRLQDSWLKELVDLLRTLGRLEHTVIVVTSDHGLRTRAEDPSLPIGRISEAMFRVPLLIYAPQALSSPVTIAHPTSHIDLTPTLLTLLGKSAAAAEMQGVPLWQRSSRERLYLLGANYGGADGFVEDGTYYMRQALSGAVHQARQFAFRDVTQVSRESPTIPFVTGALEEATQLQQALVSRLLVERRVSRVTGAGEAEAAVNQRTGNVHHRGSPPAFVRE